MTEQEILDRLATLPSGGITIKKFKAPSGKTYEYPYLQWTEDGKQKSRRLSEDEVDRVAALLSERKELEALLRSKDYPATSNIIGKPEFLTNVIIGNPLHALVESVRGYRKREGYRDVRDYVHGPTTNKVFVLYGLRRTGKTTIIQQVIADMDEESFERTAFVQISAKDKFADLNKDLKFLQSRGFRNVFIDEVTLMEDFIEGAALLSDIYASSGMKIVLTGTDSLGFWIAKSNELFDRCVLLHTTFISYREFSYVLGIDGIDDYIRYGGTMSLSGEHYNPAFVNKGTTDEYVDSAIAQNIQRSLKHYQYEGHFRHLYGLYEKGELTGAINRVIEDMNHRFTLEVLQREFKSNDLKISANNLRKDRYNPSTVLDDIDVDAFTHRLKEMLSIKNKGEQIVLLDEGHVSEIEEYLRALDLIDYIDVLDIGFAGSSNKRIVFTQPGLRYAQAKFFVDSLADDPLFQSLSIEERTRINGRVLNEIKGRMAEDIILLETKLAYPDMKVFKLQFADGEFDMVVADPNALESEIYEIKYSKEAVREQARHMMDQDKCEAASYRFGRIRKKTVLYRGENIPVDENGIEYRNIEAYLKALE